MKPNLLIILVLAALTLNVNCKQDDSWKWMDYVGSKLSEISENLPEYTADLQKTMKNYADEIQKNYEGSQLQDFVEKLPENAGKLYENVLEKADEISKNYEGSELQKMANKVQEEAQKYASKIGEQYKGSKLEKFAEKLPEYTDQILEKLEEKEHLLKENLKTFAEEVNKNYQGSKIQKKVNEIFENAQSHAQSTFGDIAAEINKNYQGSELQKMADELMKNAQDQGEKMKNTLSEYMNELKELSDVIEEQKARRGKSLKTRGNGRNPIECVLGKIRSTEDISLKTMFAGGLVGAIRNSLRYTIEHGGRKSNIVTVRDKSSISSLGNARIWTRVDRPHGTSPYYHINVNRKITGVKDPHLKISEFSAKTAGITGSALKFINEVAPTVMMMSSAYEAYDMVKDGANIQKKVIDTASTSAGGYFGSYIGSSIGTLFFPGIGTLTGSIVGGAYGGEFGECFSDSLEDIYEYASELWDIYQQDSCYPEYENKKEEFFGLWMDQNKCIVGY